MVLGSNRLEPRQNDKDLNGVTGALSGQYLIPKLQKDIDFWPVRILHHVLSYLSKSLNFLKKNFMTSSL